MTPYLQQQLVLVAVSAALASAVDFGLGSSKALRARPLLRFVASYVALAAPLLGWVIAVRKLDHSHSTFQFISVAVGFYAGAFVLPLLALGRNLRTSAPSAAPRSRAVLALAALAPLVGAYALLVEPDRLVTVERELRFDAWAADREPLRIVHVSDLQTVGACEREREAARRINALEPDLIVITGDYAAGPFSDPEPAVAAARAFFAALVRPRFGLVCVPGHAEPERLRQRIFEGFDVHYLANSELELELDPPSTPNARRLRIFGSRTLHEGFDVSRFEPRRAPGTLNLFLSHEPDAAWEILDKHVDLHLCGHTHGGQIALPFLGAPMTLSQLPRSFARGLHEFGPHWMNVNPGIGMEGNFAPRIRFFCPPQIDLLVLRGGGAPRMSGPVPART
jgi:predicted MPP superfamily phosphohydrolase